MEGFDLNIGKKLHDLRKKKDYSLSELEELSGVSKSMLGQIERGESNPTVKTLWKIAKSLNVSFSFFVEDKSSVISKISPSNVVPIIEKENMYRVYPLVPFQEKKGFEIYLTEIEPGHSYKSEPHSIGVEEYVLVLKGVLEIVVGDNKLVAQKGEIIYFEADCIHTYNNKTESMVKTYNIIYYS